MRKILPVTCMCLVIAWTQVVAQEQTVTGKVTSAEDGSPVPGVNVVVKGTARGTVTDAGGNYTLLVPTNSTLVFSFIGQDDSETLPFSFSKDN